MNKLTDACNIYTLYAENTLAKQEPKMHVDEYGTKTWYLNGRWHREDGPAVEYGNGSKAWYLHGKLHRENGPAAEYANGNKFWYMHDKQHREDGPAVEWADGTKEWWLNGEQYSDAEQWAQAMLKMHNKPATPDDVKRFLRSIYKKKSLL